MQQHNTGDNLWSNVLPGQNTWDTKPSLIVNAYIKRHLMNFKKKEYHMRGGALVWNISTTVVES